MIRAQLMGAHAHRSRSGVGVSIWLREGRYLARGYYHKQAFGETLGPNEAEAVARLRELLVEIDQNAYVRPSRARKRFINKYQPSRLTLRQLVSEYLAETRRLRGKKTTDTYKTRLLPILDFAELPANCQRWPRAEDIDREFAIALRAFLFQYAVTPNGRAGAKPKAMSARTVINDLECLRTMLAWARRADVRRLPVDWVSPLTAELIGKPAPKDPLREDPLPTEVRSQLVPHMDRWQLAHLCLSLVLPLRPEEAAGLLISDVNFDKGWLELGTRLGGGDYTKGRQSFKLPFPPQFRSILLACVAGRGEGPLLRSRRAFAMRSTAQVSSFEDLTRLFEEQLLQLPTDTVQNEQDRKQLFRKLLRKLGGISADRLAVEFQKVLIRAGMARGPTLYSLRHAATQGLKDANLPHLDMLYLTSHSTSNILNEYTPVDPVRSMQKYFATIQPLLDVITAKARELSLAVEANQLVGLAMGQDR
jgi:integrase